MALRNSSQAWVPSRQLGLSCLAQLQAPDLTAASPCVVCVRATQIAELFLSEKPVEAAVLRAAVRRATLALKFQPVLMGSAFKNKGGAGSDTIVMSTCAHRSPHLTK